MIWIAPSEKDTATQTLEKRLWDSADQFRANSGQDKWARRQPPFGLAPRARRVRLRRQQPKQYSGPILGIIFLRFAEVRFALQRAKLEKASTRGKRPGVRVRRLHQVAAPGLIGQRLSMQPASCSCRMPPFLPSSFILPPFDVLASPPFNVNAVD